MSTNNFLLASKIRLRFLTNQGELSAEQLWQLSITKLAELIRKLKKELKNDNDDDLSFLDESTKKVDTIAKLRFDVAKEIYLDRMDDLNAAKKISEDKAHNAKILEIIRNKKDQEMNDKSIEDLEKMLR